MNNGDDTPKSNVTDYTVRAEVCDPTVDATRESFCQKYSDSTTDHYKPVGLLQTYGESGRLRFGLISGTYGTPRDGGVLRRNIGKLAGNGIGDCKAGDEIRMSTGQFCLATNSGSEGIINTISNFRLTQWNYTDNWSDCNDYSILNRTSSKHLDDPGSGGTGAYKCSGWGNPIAEMYAEALRYVGDVGTTRTAYYSSTGDLSGLPGSVKWLDPYRAPTDGGNSYCATCNILVMSSGLPSFDSDNIPSVPRLASPESATNLVGAAESINGGRWMAGRVSTTPRYDALNTHEDICQGLEVSGLSLVRGLCPDSPSTEGSYLMAGLAYTASQTDMRPGLQGKDDAKDKVTPTTYTVAMAENLPKFEVSVGTGKISLAPLCQANNTGAAKIADAGWRSCFLGSVGVGTKQSTVGAKKVYGRPLKADGSAGSFSLVWEDSLWGNDHDNDVVSMMTYCVGAACRETGGFNDICWRAQDSAICNGSQTLTSTVGADEVLVRVENLSAYAGNAMLTGYTIVGSDAANNVQRLVLRPGNENGSVISSREDPPSTWAAPRVIKFKLATGQANVLESPLWYAAKYGVPAGKNWDVDNNGQPDNYFLARNPAKLKAALGAIFEGAAGDNAPVSGSGSGARIGIGSFTLAASYNVPDDSNDWTGDLTASRVGSVGEDGAVLWRASTKITSTDRTIYMATAPTGVDGDGDLIPVTAAEFTSANVPGADRVAKLSRMGLENVPTWFGSATTVDTLVSYLRGNAVNGFRGRGSILGDIVNSSPEVVSPKDDYGYGAWSGFTSVPWKQTLGVAYKSYLVAKAAAGAAPSMAYVGANDGFLHAFDATDSAAGGSEVFAFMPSAALGHIAELANPTYVHRYYVDGLMTAGDTYYDGDWHTTLVGSTGAGGASQAPSSTRVGHGSVFGLDISDPETFDEESVLWEISGDNDSDMGFVLGKPVIVPVASASGPRFVAMFGNGVNSANGQPTLFVVDVQTGEVLRRLKPAGHNVRNGLMNIAPIAQKNFDRMVDTVYGGDMEGNLWKFDVSDPNPANWKIAYAGAPLFTATRDDVAQPITGGLEVSGGPGGGVSIFFGTGRYFADGDNLGGTTLPVESIYGIWDNQTGPVGGRGELVGQTIVSSADSNGYQTRGVTSNAVNYTQKRGWYVDLVVDGVGTGERFIGNPNIQNGRVFFTTYTTGEASCGPGGGTNWLYGLNLLTGAGSMSGVTTSIGGTSVCTGNCGAVALGKGGSSTNSPPTKDTSIFVPKLTPCDPSDPSCTVDSLIGAEQCTFVLRAVGADPLYLPRPCGRQSWRQVR
ncbi:MAG TPA: PilC/PilY family type IV pilus protein [Stenotrophomonas sp.]